MAVASASARLVRLTRSLVVRHKGGAISNLRLPWYNSDSVDDALDPQSLLPSDKTDVDNLLGFYKSHKLWSSSLVPHPAVSRFSTLDLPLPSSFSEGKNLHFVQMMLFPTKYFGWFSIYAKEKEADRYTSLFTSKFAMEPILTPNAKQHRPYDPNEYELIHGCITPEVASTLSFNLSDYEMEPIVLGPGIQGDTFKGRCLATGRTVLIKKYKYPLCMTTGEPREVFFSKNVEHPAIREMECAWVDRDGVAWVAMEYYDKSFDDLLDENPEFDYEERLSFFRMGAHAVKYLGGEKIAYIDVEPGNLLVNKDLGSAMADLGSCVLIDERNRCHASHFVSWAKEYAAPELNGMKDHDLKAASYSLGMLYFVAMSSEFYTKRERVERVKKLRQLHKHKDWKKNARKVWEDSGLSKGFKGSFDLLKRMIDPNAENRPDPEEILREA